VRQRSRGQIPSHERQRQARSTNTRTRLAQRGMAAANPIPDGWVAADEPIDAIRERVAQVGL
jgi:hypothetical protein